MPAPERPSNPPLGVPVPSLNDPPHIEADYVDRVDITSTSYFRTEVGTLYSALTGADQKIVDANPTLFLVQEILSANTFPYAYRFWANQYVETHGQEYDRKYRVPIPFVNRFAKQNTEIGTAQGTIEPINRDLALIKTIDTAAMLVAVAGIAYPYPDTTNVFIPDELTALDAYYSKSEGEGVGADSSSAAGAGGTWFAKAESSSSGKSSASIKPELVPTIVERPSRDRPTTRWNFFVEMSNDPAVTRAAIIAKLQQVLGTTVGDFPKWRPKPLSFILTGESKSVNARSNHSESKSANTDGGSSTGSGSGASIDKDAESTIGTKQISATIHGALSVSNPTGTAGSAFGVTVNGAVVPDTIAATTPSSIPTSGYVIIRATAELFEAPILMIDAEVLNWADV